MNKTVIKVENLSKQYRLGQVGTGTISHDVNRWWHTIRGKEDPYLKIGEENDRTSKGNSEYVWALRDINFEVKQGEVLGIIGRNGAGKSTLLKILSRTTMPTTGNIKIKGRIASLLEVGTGFHPELSGRDNIFLNGAILGMTKGEIKRKFDEIVDFAGVEKYIDTPVKRYSSGMYVRLAFGVAAHLEPEILIVDEVLAVGDAEFQKKALGKMKDVSNKDGRTVLFVSHNMAAVRNLCSKAILLKNGQVSIYDEVNKVTEIYYADQNNERHYSFDLSHVKRYDHCGEKMKLTKVVFNDNHPIYYGDALKVDFYFETHKNIEDFNFGIGLNSMEEVRLLTIDSDSTLIDKPVMNLQKGAHCVSLNVEQFNLSPGIYTFDAGLREGAGSPDLLDMVIKQFGIEILPDSNTPIHLTEGQTGGYRPIANVVYVNQPIITEKTVATLKSHNHD